MFNPRTVQRIVAFAALLAFGVAGAGIAAAESDMDFDRPGGYHHGEGPQDRWGAWADLSDEQRRKIEAEKRSFREATSDLRRKIYQKRLEMRSEFAEENPDADRLGSLQKEISEMRSRLDQQRLAHRLRIKEIAPEWHGCGWGRRGGKGGPHGYGPRHGGRFGSGQQGCRW